MRDSTARHSLVGSESVDSRPPLDYLQPSPVRGQLEPYREKTRAGWRFLQCTDTPDELKVLLPPRTAQIYSQLLDAETSELAKQRDASWERILEIRRLKDRMIRKCGRLARVWGASKPGTGTLFRTVYAPADFRLKEMEKWIRYQENGSITIRSTHTGEPHLSRRPSNHSIRRRSSFCCDRCASTTHPDPDHQATRTIHRRPSVTHSNRSSWVDPGSKRSLANLARRSSTSSIHDISIQNDGQPYSQTVYRSNNAIEDNVRGIHAVLEPYVAKSRSRTPPRRRSALFTEDTPLVESPRVVSPDPLPHPYRSRNSDMFTAGADDSSDTTDDEDHSTNETLEARPREIEGQPRPTLAHRRSSLKKSTGSARASMDAAKNVAWAMDHDWQEQVKKFDEATNDAEAADREWDVARTVYEEELSDMKALRQNLSRTLSRLRAETERLEKEDEVMKDKESKLRESFTQLEQTQNQYRAKVQAVLDETKGVLTLCGNKRSVQFDPSS